MTRWLPTPGRLSGHFEYLTETLGGPARRTTILLLAAVLALGSADLGTIGALAPQLETSLHIGNIDVGLLVTVSALAGAAGMLPVGVATDRWRRTTLILAALALWGVAQVVSALSVSFLMLLLVRLALGSLTAVTGPTVASLTGDLFPAEERSRMYGFILTGELFGAGLGLLIAGLVASWAGWRAAFVVMAIPSVVLVWAFRRWLPEPARGGQSRLEVGATGILAAEDAERSTGSGVDQSTSEGATEDGERSAARSKGPDQGPADDQRTAGSEEGGRQGTGSPRSTAGSNAAGQKEEVTIHEVVAEHGIDPDPRAVLDRDPLSLSWWRAARFVLRVRSNLTMIVASALGYFLLSGLETFALIYLKGHFGLDQGEATIMVVAVGGAAIAGAVLGGRYCDILIRRGRIDGRLLVAAVGFLCSAALFVPGVVSPWIALSVPFFLAAGFFLSAPNPGLDAARLDIMPTMLWGRAESVRSLLKGLLQAFAPLLFGITSAAFGGQSQGLGAGVGGSGSKAVAANSMGLEPTFVIMTIPVVLAGLAVLWGRRYYPGDVAGAAASEEAFPPTAGDGQDPPSREPAEPRGRPDKGRRSEPRLATSTDP